MTTEENKDHTGAIQAECPRLFVYGTLRSDIGNRMAGVLAENASRVGVATVRGKLLDLGAFPGFSHGEGVVTGELWEITEPLVWNTLDSYEGEGSLYHREIVTAFMEDGTEHQTWIYRYARSAGDYDEVESGDWAKR